MQGRPEWKGPLFQPMAYILSLKAKRVRPLLTLLAYQAVNDRPAQEAMNLAAAVELFHNFTLIHDDIMDEASLRRGMPTVHKKWDVNTAILAGDGMFAYCIELLTQDFPQQAGALCREFSRMAVDVCDGQARDMQLMGRLEVQISDYIEMIRRKTAVLIGSGLCLGALAAGAGEEDSAAFRQWGEAAGLGFQLRDDYLDAFGDGAKVGKQVGGDILQNKMTFLVLTAWGRADEMGRQQMQQLLFEERDPQAKVGGMLHQFERWGAKEAIEQEMNHQFSLADETGGRLARFPGTAQIQSLFTELKNRES